MPDVVELRQVPGGASRQAWFVDAGTGAQVPCPVPALRPAGTPTPAVPFTRCRSRPRSWPSCTATACTVPRVIAAHPTRAGGAAGTGRRRHLVPADRGSRRTGADRPDFIGKLAALHRIDAQQLTIPSLGPGGPGRRARPRGDRRDAGTTEQVRETRAAAGVLHRLAGPHVPDYDGPTVMVQGDTGPGNFMYADGVVTAVVDWELAHFGDPMDDIAWLSLRTVQDTFTDFPARLAEYEQLSGHRIDDDRVWYYRLFAETRLASMSPGRVDTRASCACRFTRCGQQPDLRHAAPPPAGGGAGACRRHPRGRRGSCPRGGRRATSEHSSVYEAAASACPAPRPDRPTRWPCATSKVLRDW